MPASSADTASADTIADWCLLHLGSPPVHSFITHAPGSQLWGSSSGGTVVAVKVSQDSPQIACEGAHRLVHAHGIDCAAPLAGP